MSKQVTPTHSSLWAAWGSLVFASGTLLCCVLPAVMVALGAGAALAGLVTVVPQLVWLSAHKVLVFGSAGTMLTLAGWMQWRARFSPCPADSALAAACVRTRRASLILYGMALSAFFVGTVFAFVLPVLFAP